MDKDMATLRRIKYRFSKFLGLIPLIDMKPFNFLKIPPLRKKEDKVKLEEIFEEATQN